MSYTPPLGNAANVTWVGEPAYTPPSGNAVGVSWQTGAAPDAVEGTAAATLATITITGAALATFGAVTGTGTAAGTVVALSVTGAAAAATGASGSAAAQVATLTLSGAVTAQLVTAGPAAGTIPFATGITPSITAQHPRYELRGQVRLAGNPVERRVRAYARSTGALLGQGDTTGGFFRIPAGFAEIECTVLPIDLATDATDYEPPTANRVLCVLAEDDA